MYSLAREVQFEGPPGITPCETGSFLSPSSSYLH